MNRSFSNLLPLFGLALLLAGCQGQTTPKVAGKPEFSPERTKTWSVPTDQQAKEFAERLQIAMLAGDVEGFNALIDWEAILERSTSALPVSNQQRKLIMQGARQGMSGSGGLGAKIIDAGKAGGTYRLLRIHTQGDKKYARFRLLHPDSGLNYHDLLLTSQEDSVVRAPDIYVFLSGENLSDTMHRLLLLQLPSKSLLERLAGKDKDLAKNADTIAEMSQANSTGNFPRTMQLYESLPAQLRDDKGPALIYMQAVQQSGDSEKYLKFLDDWRTRFPGDASANLMSIDAYLLKKQYDKAFEAIDQLDTAVGTDPYLNVMRANVAYEADDVPKSKEFLQKAIAADLQLIDPYWQLLAISLRQQDFDETLRILNLLESDYGQTFSDLREVPDYSEFVKSPQYEEWVNRP